jgi:2'-5' RNA ligase
MLESLPPRQEFEVWPPHITIVPWFPVDDKTKLDKLLSKIAQKHQPFEVKAGGIEEWGNDDKFEVLVIKDKGPIRKLHKDVFKVLEKNGFPIHQKDFLGAKYQPHVTLRNQEARTIHFELGETIHVSRFSLIKQDRLKGSGRMIKTVVKDYELTA